MFQSHAGSIEAVGNGVHLDQTLVFQSHAGSIEAYVLWREPEAEVIVSIPRWFD